MKVVLLGQCKNATGTLSSAIEMITGGNRTGWIPSRVMSGNDINLNSVSNYSIIHDDPFPFYFKELYNEYGDNAKYILSYRDENEWFDSFKADFYHAWNKSYRFKQTLYPIKELHESFRKDFIKIYLQLNKEIMNFFKKKDNNIFLSLEVEDFKNRSHKENWCILFDFLEVEYNDKILSKPFLHTHKRNPSDTQYYKKLRDGE